MDMNERREQNDGEVIIYLVIAGIVGYVLIFLALLLGVVVTIGLTAGAGYLGYRAATSTGLWESRRISRDKQIEAARLRELEHYKAQGKDWMQQIVNNYYDDKQRDLYQKEEARLDKLTKNARKIKEVLK